MKPEFYSTRAVIALLLMTMLSGLSVSCKRNENRERIARSVGAGSEILVVTQNSEQWQGSIGDALRNYFGQPQYGLPQDEPLYRLSNINLDKLSDMFKKHRNILAIEINASVSEAVVETRSDLWAKPQRVVKIIAPDAESWVAAFEQNQSGIKLLYDKAERERLLNILRPTANPALMEQVVRSFGLKLMLPDGFYVAKQEPGFMWLRRETPEMSYGLVIYSLPYRDTLDFDPRFLIGRRDSVMQRHIPGPVQGSFMSTEKEFVPPLVTNTVNYVTPFAAEMRGMWNVVGDFMAGPFLSYTFPDPRNNRLVTVEGFVYLPNKPKRDHLRQLEAILYSLSFVDPGAASR
ncbi:MAG TPA: DUF4837 family protein [Bacteroidales bacterium]|nr:DUF4837 family protein [Bacteroidales bacterium]